MASLMTERLELVPQRAGSLAARIQVLSALLHLEISSGRAAGGWWYRSGRHLACVPVVSGHSARYVDVRRSATAFARSLYREGESSGRFKRPTSTAWTTVSGLVAHPAHPLFHFLPFGVRGLFAGAAAAARAPPALTDTRHRVKAHGHCHMVVD